MRKAGHSTVTEGDGTSPPVSFGKANPDLAFNVPYSFGTRVRVDGKHGIEGVVTGYAIYPQVSEVKVSWFANGDSKADWFAEWRIIEIVE